MKINNFDLIQILNILDSYSDKKLPQKITFAITKNLILLQDEAKSYQESLKKLLEKYDSYIIKDENGNNKMDKQGVPEIQESQQQNFNNELMELLQMTLEINLYQIEEDSFNYEDEERYDSLSAQDIIKLEQILCKQDKEPKED